MVQERSSHLVREDPQHGTGKKEKVSGKEQERGVLLEGENPITSRHEEKANSRRKPFP